MFSLHIYLFDFFTNLIDFFMDLKIFQHEFMKNQTLSLGSYWYTLKLLNICSSQDSMKMKISSDYAHLNNQLASRVCSKPVSV